MIGNVFIFFAVLFLVGICTSMFTSDTAKTYESLWGAVVIISMVLGGVGMLVTIAVMLLAAI